MKVVRPPVPGRWVTLARPLTDRASLVRSCSRMAIRLSVARLHVVEIKVVSTLHRNVRKRLPSSCRYMRTRRTSLPAKLEPKTLLEKHIHDAQEVFRVILEVGIMND